MPDIPFPADQLQKDQEKYEVAKNMLEKYKTPPQKLHLRYKDSQNLVKRTPVVRECTLVPPPRKKTPSKKQYKKNSWTIYLVKVHV